MLYPTIPQNRIVNDGLVLYLDAGIKGSYSGTGTNWNDLASVNNATMFNSPNFNNANGGQINFNGINQYCTLGSGTSNISFGLGTSFTIELVFSILDYTSFNSLLTRHVIASSQFTDYMIFYGNSEFYFGTGQATDPVAWLASTAFNQNNTIHHACGVLSSTGSTTGSKVLYKNGQSVASGNYTEKANSTTNPTYIGQSIAGTGNLSGSIYLIRIYNRALSNQEVLQNFEATRGRFSI